MRAVPDISKLMASSRDPVILERALGRLLLDATFCERFFANPSTAVWEAGLPLSPIEVDTLSRLSQAAIVRFRESFEPRLRRHSLNDAAAPRDSARRRHRGEAP